MLARLSPDAQGSRRKEFLTSSRRHSHPPVPKPVREPNHCNLEPFKPETPKITPYLVLAQARLTLQVVCLGLAHFRLPVRPPKSPSRPTRENPGRPCGGGLGGGSCQTPRWRRIVSTTCGWLMRAIKQMGLWQTGQRSGSTSKTRGIKWRAAGHPGQGGSPHQAGLGLAFRTAHSALRIQWVRFAARAGLDGKGFSGMIPASWPSRHA
jgi:hypothetical protein